MKVYRPLLEKYSRQAARYDSRWNRSSGDALLNATLDAVPWKGLHRVLDVGCGTGLLEEAVSGRFPPQSCLIGVDLSLAMLEQARAKFNGTPRFGWSNAAAEHLPFPPACFDAVVCANSFHYYRHPDQALQEFRRVLRPGGWLVLGDWCGDYFICKLSRWMLRLRDQTFRPYAMKHCYSMKQAGELLAQAGFRIQSAQKFKIDWRWGGMVYRARA